MKYPQLILKDGREKSLIRRHPWIFSGAVADIEGNLQNGETVEVITNDSEYIAWAAYSPKSQIRARVWSWRKDDIPSENLFRSRIFKAVEARKNLLSITNAMRLVNAESDGLPGLIVDRYGDTLAVQMLSSGAEYWRNLIIDLLEEATGISTIYERSDVEVRKLEGLEPSVGLVRGTQMKDLIQIHEHGVRFWVSVYEGQKTGYYLDQRENRFRLRDFSIGRDVLDCFSYTGGFGVNALAGGAESVTMVDSSKEALELASKNVKLNKLSKNNTNYIQADVFKQLRLYRDEGRTFDLVILDPPKFAPTKKQAGSASRGYKDINLLSFKILRPGGLLFTFSCSGGISAELFQKIVAGAALDAGVDVQVIGYMRQDIDHPFALTFPEGAYLKGLICRIV